MTYMNNVISFLEIVIALYTLGFLLKLTSIKRIFRYKQYPLVLISPVILVIMFVAAYWIMGLFDRYDNVFLRWLLSGRMWIMGWNVILFFAYFLVRIIIVSVLKRRNTLPDILSENGSSYYRIDDDFHLYFFNEDHVNFRRLLKYIKHLTILYSGYLLTIIYVNGAESAYWYRVFPVASVILFTEVCLYLDGYTKAEYIKDVGGESITSSLQGNYAKLRQVYERLFPDDLISAHTGNEFGAKQGATEYLRSLEKSADPIDQIAADYFSFLPGKNGLFDVDMIGLTCRLLHGKSTVILNPFYRDLSDYLLLPVANQLINNRKCLIIVGRGSIAPDAKQWMKTILKDYCRTERLWRVGDLDNTEPDCEVGILSFSQLYDFDVIRTNRSFLENTGLVLLLEPSKMLTTSQTGLANLADIINTRGNAVYCVCDHDADGLSDTLSHVLKVSITDVISSPKPRSIYTILGWDASGDYQRQRLFGKEVHYLGNGIEIAATALKNQVPHVTWYSESNAPVKDIRWIAGQYYPQICRYSSLPSQQKTIDDYISFSSNLWGSERTENEFIIAEDEFCNLFASARTYLSRGTEQTFVNVISENYLLRDYLRFNRQMFINDPKAVPAISSAYVKTERNTVHRLILKMAAAPVKESEILHELSLLNIKTDDVYDTLTELISRYSVDVTRDAIITVLQKNELNDELEPINVKYYSIADKTFEKHFRRTLRNAYFIVEDEVEGRENIDARLYEHVTQIVMPGQLITHDGKLYRVHSVNPDECVLHRAADHYSGRRYYRQNRKYQFGEFCETDHIRRVMDIEIAKERRDFSVSTAGYLDMSEYGNLRTSRYVDLSDDVSVREYDRSYHNKNVLRIKMQETSVNIRYTVSLLLTEIFRSVFPEAFDYIAVLAEKPETITGVLEKFSYGIGGIFDSDSIYIVEDSDMDIGLIEAIDYNIIRIFEILADYIDWHDEAVKMPEKETKLPEEVVLPPDQPLKKEGNIFVRLFRKLIGFFTKNKKKDEPAPAAEVIPESADKPEEPAQEEKTAPETKEGGQENESPLPKEYYPEREDVDVSEPVLNPVDGAPDDIDIILPVDETDYQRRCYLKFGFERIDPTIDLINLRTYLNSHGWTDNAITKSRHRDPFTETALDLDAVETCDFCGRPISGVSFERLADGRVRCGECARTAIDDVEEFKELAKRTEQMVEDLYNISFNTSISVKAADARTIAKRRGMLFRPTPGFDGRVLGFAVNRNGQYSIMMENGSPRLAAVETFGHEMTHIWQYMNWNDSQIVKLYGNQRNRLIVYEGMATWAACQILYAMGETAYAEQNEQIMASRDDEYGIGFRLYREKYGFVKTGDIPMNTPFNQFPPL